MNELDAEHYRILPFGDGFCVIERTPDGYEIPRGWTYLSEKMAEGAIAYVATGIDYPKIIESQTLLFQDIEGGVCISCKHGPGGPPRRLNPCAVRIETPGSHNREGA
jgi:hypothetical protein